MKHPGRWLWLLVPVVLIALLAALFGGPGDQGDGEVLNWNSPKMRALEKDWQSLWDRNEKNEGNLPPKQMYGETVTLVNRLFRKRLSNQNLRDLAASAEMVPIVVHERGRFASEVLPFMVAAFVKSGDRANLVNLLSKRCPDRITFWENVEYYLAIRGTRLKDPILILGEAYSKCEVPETRRTLAAALRRSFAGYKIPGTDDAEFVHNAMQWYSQEKGRLVVNKDYIRNESVGLLTIEASELHPEYYDKPPDQAELLFRVKPASESSNR